MSHSNSSLNCFASCMAKYEQNYILHNKPNKVSPHLIFGAMAHEVLYKAGKLRDDAEDKVVQPGDYYSVIPSEVLYTELKVEFNINSWTKYFVPIIKQCAKYEEDLVKSLGNNVKIERELKVQLTVDELASMGYKNIKQPLVGIIDCLMYNDTEAIIIDYKFSSGRKTQDDFDMNSQLPLYAFLVNKLYKIKLHNIRYGYIDIPKQTFGDPTVLTNGTLSRAKSQNVSQELYGKAVLAVHGDDPYYNCEPGGYYYDCWCAMALNKAAYLSIQYLDEDTYNNVISDLMKAASMIDFMVENKMPFLRKYDAYTCKGCEYIDTCKPWLTLGSKED